MAGQVQGVGFRWCAARQAEALGVSGAIRNCSDGTVEVSVEGPPPALERLVSWLRVGPPGARVDLVEEIPASLPIPASGFRVVP